MSESLTDFLLARIAEDERMWQTWSAPLPPTPFLAECEAKRRIVEIASPARNDDGALIPGSGISDILRALALPYADHDDYRSEWRP